ncbi:MAG: amidohydrolase [Eubacteriaceae bacterium]|nr:amidohydrolase [Eubacteriaceae bacterium]MBR5995676.1 amidohydrolase [Eubacteriaceae bacterium]
MDHIKNNIEKYHEAMIAERRHIHSHPELSGNEYGTSAYIQEELGKAGIPFELVPPGRSVVAVIRGEYPGKTILLRSDIDALPVTEATGLPFSSEVPGAMHACGHDAHAAIGITVAKVLNDLRSRLHGTAKVVFQEAEETGSGAKHVLESGLIDDADNSLMLHVDVTHPTGFFATNYGVRSAKTAVSKVVVQGRGGHSAFPQNAVNPIPIAARIIEAVSEITAYEIAREDFAVISPTVVAGGTKNNIIPQSCEIIFNARYYDSRFDEVIPELISKKSKNIAASAGGAAETSYSSHGIPMINDEDSVKRALSVIERIWGKDKIDLTPPGLFGDDFAYIQEKVPGAAVNIGAALEGNTAALHSPTMMVDEACMDIAARFATEYIAEYLEYAE